MCPWGMSECVHACDDIEMQDPLLPFHWHPWYDYTNNFKHSIPVASEMHVNANVSAWVMRRCNDEFQNRSLYIILLLIMEMIFCVAFASLYYIQLTQFYPTKCVTEGMSGDDDNVDRINDEYSLRLSLSHPTVDSTTDFDQSVSVTLETCWIE